MSSKNWKAWEECRRDRNKRKMINYCIWKFLEFKICVVEKFSPFTFFLLRIKFPSFFRSCNVTVAIFSIKPSCSCSPTPKELLFFLLSFHPFSYSFIFFWERKLNHYYRNDLPAFVVSSASFIIIFSYFMENHFRSITHYPHLKIFPSSHHDEMKGGAKKTMSMP